MRPKMRRSPPPSDRWLSLSRRLWAVALVLWIAIVFVGTWNGRLDGGRAAIGFLLLGLISVARNADPARSWPRPVGLLASAAFIGFCGVLIRASWGTSDWTYLALVAAVAATYLVLIAVALALERRRAADAAGRSA
jgi:hypothetical protein